MSDTAIVFIVILSTEHGDDVAACRSQEMALSVAGKMIEETIDEIEAEIDGNEAGTESLKTLQGHLKNQQFDEAITLYNKLHDDFMSISNTHYLRIKKSNLR